MITKLKVWKPNNDIHIYYTSEHPIDDISGYATKVKNIEPMGYTGFVLAKEDGEIKVVNYLNFEYWIND